MRAVLQRVTRARCTVEGQVTGETGPGFLILLGIAPGDSPETARQLAAKVVKLRVFGDEAGKMNRSLRDTAGGLLLVSQFTLAADTRKGMRPGFSTAAPPDAAEAVFGRLLAECRARHGGPVETGRFGAHMAVGLVNDGPVTFLLRA